MNAKPINSAADRLASAWGGVVALATVAVALWGVPAFADAGARPVGLALLAVLAGLSALTALGAWRRLR